MMMEDCFRSTSDVSMEPDQSRKEKNNSHDRKKQTRIVFFHFPFKIPVVSFWRWKNNVGNAFGYKIIDRIFKKWSKKSVK